MTDPDQNLDDVRGIYPMLYAFFDDHGGLDRAAMRRQVDGCIDAGCHGIAVGGLATETNKLSTEERRTLVEWVAEQIAGRVPLSVTIAENNVTGQSGAVAHAADNGAAWVVLQPPPVRGVTEAGLIGFYGAVADASPVPVGIQNAPEYIGIGLSDAGFATLNKNHPNVAIIKAEGPATYISGLVAATNGAYKLLNGRNGMEHVDSLRAGCDGMVPGVETIDIHVAIFEAFAAGDEAEADRIFALNLPLINFLMTSVDHLICYGKRLAARRLGLAEPNDRAPAQQPTDFGIQVLEHWSKNLDTL
jgi:2-keto-3-deoxy-L-arabinonate dehydratase